MRAALRRDHAPQEVDRHTAGLHIRGDTSRFSSSRARSRRCASRLCMSSCGWRARHTGAAGEAASAWAAWPFYLHFGQGFSIRSSVSHLLDKRFVERPSTLLLLGI